MSENNLEGEQQEQCKEAKFVDDNSAVLIQRVTSVMAIADDLHKNKIIHDEKYSEIRAEKTDQEKMRNLFESLKSGGDKVKIVFYNLLEKHEPHLFKDLGGVSRKRKLADPESSNPVPCKRLNTESNGQNNPYFNSASPSAPIPAQINIVTNEKRPSVNIKNVSILNKMEQKPPSPKKEKKPPAPKKEKKTPAPKKEKKTPATKKEKKTPAPKKEKKTPATKKEKKTPAPKKEKKTPAPKKVKKTPATKKVKKTPAPKKVKKTPATKKVKKTPATKKVKKPPAPKKVKKTPAPKKVKKAAARK